MTHRHSLDGGGYDRPAAPAHRVRLAFPPLLRHIGPAGSGR
jgi:hypothetical protein